MNEHVTDTRERREVLAREIVELLGLGRSQRPVFAGDDVAPELRESEALAQVVTAHVRSLGDQTPQMTQVYADYWSAFELEQLLAFYRSDLGARFRAFLPVFRAEMARLTASAYQSNIGEIKEIMRRGRPEPPPH